MALACMQIHPAHSNPLHAPEPVDARALQALYPYATVIRVTAEAYPELEKSLRRLGYSPQGDTMSLLLATHESGAATPQPLSAPAPQSSTVDCNARSGQSAGNIGIDINLSTGGHAGDRRSGGRGSDDNAALILVIVGAVVLVVWTVYAIKYIADAASGRLDPCVRRWSEWATTFTSINSPRPQYGYFSGLRYLTGVDREGLTFGLSAELGHADVLLAEVSTLRMQGLYWLLGPLLRWDLSGTPHPSYFQMELMVGSTENKEMGVIAAAKLGLNFGLSDRLRLGISYGALHLNLHEQGLILNRSQFYTLWGLDLGYRF